MRTLAAALAMVAAAACTNGGSPAPTAAPTAAPTTGPPSAPIGGTLAFATFDTVRLVLPDGTVRTIASPVSEAESFAWTADGRYVAWLSAAPRGGQALTVHEPATGRTASWAGTQPSEGLVGTATGFATVYRPAGKTSVLVVADPATMLAGGTPRIVPLRLRSTGVLTTSGRVVVEAPKAGAAFTGGPSTVYEVAADGRVTPLFGNSRDWPVHHAALTPDGRRVVHSAGERTGKDRSKEWVVVRDLTAQRDLAVASPERDGAVPFVRSIVTGADGQVVAAVGYHGADGEEAGTEAYSLSGDTWVRVAGDAQWAASGPRGVIAVITGDDRLEVGDADLGEGVEAAAWAPA
jgi:hypothetical protein